MSEVLTDSEFINLNKYLHDPTLRQLRFRGTVLDIKVNSTGLRYVLINGVKYIQQNPNTNSDFAAQARQGHKITWGIKPRKWALCIDDKVINKE